MNYTPYITHNRAVLLRLIAVVFAAIGLGEDGVRPEVLTRAMRSTVLHTLRPAESALRRLIFVMATELERSGYVPPKWMQRTGPNKPIVPNSEGHVRVPAFRLIDPRKWFWWIGTKSRPRAKHMPRITWIGYDDDTDRPVPPAPPSAPMDDDLLDADGLCNRLLTLKNALDDLPRQAKRMARLKARDPRKFIFKHPMRPGLPPGWRRNGEEEIDEVLKVCHQIAGWAREAPDTS